MKPDISWTFAIFASLKYNFFILLQSTWYNEVQDISMHQKLLVITIDIFKSNDEKSVWKKCNVFNIIK